MLSRLPPRPARRPRTLEQEMLRSATQDSSPFVLRLVGGWHDTANYYILTAWHEGGYLVTQLVLEGRFSQERAKLYVAQLDLHRRRIIHRDVKPANILFVRISNVVLCDPGFAQFLPVVDGSAGARLRQLRRCPNATSGSFRWEEVPMTSERCGTPRFASSEQNCGREYSHETDIWSMVSFFFILTGRVSSS
ncbi:kinase-like domain-containing protein [Mycena rosella]|uniref:Kinase-like domain-containing protein n=1 Tax=Mycena rosella TaxID=1033263 RepID=A0AAD7CPL8_MYCRO|nr:kinase-like domain-containing protein [Mycena rosella]